MWYRIFGSLTLAHDGKVTQLIGKKKEKTMQRISQIKVTCTYRAHQDGFYTCVSLVVPSNKVTLTLTNTLEFGHNF